MARALTYLLATFVALTCLGCGYGEVSPATYRFAKALYAVSNRQQADRLDHVEQQIAEYVESGELPAHEAAWLSDMCNDCRQGRWDLCQAAARRLMEDQVRR